MTIKIHFLVFYSLLDERERGREGGREGGREEGRERGREGERGNVCVGWWGIKPSFNKTEVI